MKKMERGEIHILLVDDDEAMREIGQEILKKSGYLVIVAKNGIEAIKIAHSHPQAFDLVVTDFNMPSMNGKELTQQLLSILPDLQVIISTGGSPMTKEELQAWGVSALLKKPYTQKELEDVVQQVLDHADKKKTDAHNTSISHRCNFHT